MERFITLNNVVGKLTSEVVDVKMVYPITKKSHFRLNRDLRIELSDGKKIIIPNGFVFDGSSSPRFLWAVLPSYGDFFFAAIIHDYLYRTKKKSKKFSDEEMYIWSKKINNKTIGSKIDNTVRYWGVKLFGAIVYNR